MKLFALLVLVFGMTIPASAKVVSVEELWSHLFTNGPIVWQAPTEHLPKSFWIYKRDLPRLFPADRRPSVSWRPAADPEGGGDHLASATLWSPAPHPA